LRNHKFMHKFMRHAARRAVVVSGLIEPITGRCPEIIIQDLTI